MRMESNTQHTDSNNATPETLGTAVEAQEEKTFTVSGIRLPLCPPLFSPDRAEKALTMNLKKSDLFLSSYPTCDSLWVDSILWKLVYPKLPLPRVDRTTGQLIPCREMMADDAKTPASRDYLPNIYKTFFPCHLLPLYRQVKYIYVFRSPWEVCEDYYCFLRSLGTVGCTFEEFVNEFLKGNVPYGSYFDHLEPWNRLMAEGNVLLLCNEHAERSPRSTLFKIAAFLGEPYLKMLVDNPIDEESILAIDFSDILESDSDGSDEGSSSESDDSDHQEVTTSESPRRFFERQLKGESPSPGPKRGVDSSSPWRRPFCNESQVKGIMQKVSERFSKSSLEFMWNNMMQKHLSIMSR